MKKTVSILLAVLMLLTLAIPAFAAEKQGTDIPNVYLQGQGEHIYLPDGTKIFDGGSMPDGFLADAVKQCMPTFITAMKEDTPEAWEAYRAKFFEVVLPVFGGYALDKNGDASDGSHNDKSFWNWGTDKYSDGSYKFRSNNFYQDWRLDPFVNAEELNRFIQQVKQRNGSAKVNLVGRCEGVNVIMAYLAEYGYGDVNCVEIYVQSASGVDLMNALFANEMRFDAAALRRFKQNLPPDYTIEDQMVNELLDAALEFTGDTMLLDAGLAGLQILAPKIYKELIVYMLRETYGTMPGIWALVGPDHYAKAREGVFGGYEEEYAGLLEKLDNYDAKVRQRVPEIIKNGIAAGVKFANYAKYGDFQVQPLCETNNEIGDNSVSLKAESLGATTAKYGSTLSDQYLADAEKKGTAKYISPDKMVDASTCLLPDTTWFIYGSSHTQFPAIIHDFMLKFLKANGNMTVFSDPTAPQYMVYTGPEDNGDTLVPMTAENAETLDSGTVIFKEVNWKDMILRFFKAILAFIKQLIANR